MLRLSNPYGPRQDPLAKQGAASVFMYNVLQDKEISVWGDGSVIRDFIYASDFAKACVLAVLSEKIGVLNIGSGVGLSIKELLDAIEKALGKFARVRWLPAREFDVPRVVLDCGRARQELGWKPQVSLEEGLLIMKDWMNEIIKT